MLQRVAGACNKQIYREHELGFRGTFDGELAVFFVDFRKDGYAQVRGTKGGLFIVGARPGNSNVDTKTLRSNSGTRGEIVANIVAFGLPFRQK